MEAFKGLIAPLGFTTNSIQDTLVRSNSILLCLRAGKLNYSAAETSRHWRNSRNRTEGLVIRMEWIRRLSVNYPSL